uniref:Uncharacterized protein n=1 Tax=Oryza punctata TaxID=4537 RepID=A0A0E0L110_ORYPU
MGDGRTITITGSEFTPEDGARIPKLLRGNNFHDTRQLTQHLKRYGLPEPGCDEPEEMLSEDDDDDDDDDEILESSGEKERELKACTAAEKLDT